MTDNRNIPIGRGNYNERVEGDYIQGNYNAPVIHGGSGNNITFNRIQAPDWERLKLNPPKNLQFQGSANFVGRQHELTLLRDRLQLRSAYAITAVAGMGGVGKTELAIQFVLQHEADYPGGICWLSARESDLAASIVQFAQLHMNLEVPQQDGRGNSLSLTKQVEWCWQHWQPSSGLVLIVLDDVIDVGNCRLCLPSSNRFRVLMTTRLRNLDPNIEEISLDMLLPEEALQLLTALVGQKRVEKEYQTAQQLCEWLGYLPLGLELVGRYVAKKPPNYKLALLLQRLNEQRLENEALNSEQQSLQQTLSTAQQGVLAAFELSWLELSPTTQQVAALLSLFAPNIFAWQWVESACELLNWSAADVETANEQLYALHLIQSVEDTSGEYKIKIHPLIREFLKVKLAALPQASDLKRGFVEAMVAQAKLIPNLITAELINSVKDVIPHLAEVAQYLTETISDENLILVFSRIGRFYQGQGSYALAEPWLRACAFIIRERLGEEHPFVASSFNNLALLYLYQARYAEAEPLFLQALALDRRLYGEEHSSVAFSLNNLALLYLEQARYAEAEPLLLQALALNRRFNGEEHPSVSSSLDSLASLYLHQARYAEAEPLFLQALALERRLHREEHTAVAAILQNLASLYLKQARYAEAEPLYQQALALNRRLLSFEHPFIADSLQNLASLYSKQARYVEAEPLYQQALEIASKSLGVDHPTTATIRENLKSLRDNYA
jgi:tetratricopeptide (TPR) repeat protein